MKAAQIIEYGDPSVIRINEIEKPKLTKGQVLVEVYAASLNPWDTTVRSGKASSYLQLLMPATLGGDIAGVVIDVSDDVSDFKAGDKIFGDAGLKSGSGAFAEFAAAQAGHMALAPANLNFEETASICLVGVSALQALTEYLELKSGQKILIQGGAGGIGSVAVQIAKYLGAYVAATAPTEAVELVKNYGANEVIDYKTQDFTELIHDYDVVFDTVGGETFNKSLSVLNSDGIAGSMIANFDEVENPNNIRLVKTNSQQTTERLNRLRDLIEQGVIRPNIAKTYTLDQIKDAFEARESGEVTGKIAIKIKD